MPWIPPKRLSALQPQSHFHLGTPYIFILRQITDNANEYNKNIHVLFVNLKQAFASIKRTKIHEVLQQTEMHAKLVRLI